MMKNILITFFTLSLFLVNAQLLDGNPNQYNRGDTLRGSLRPERTAFDVTYYNLNLDVSFKNKSISGYNDIYFSMVENSDSLQIDLFDNMIIDSIIYNGAKLKYLRDYNAVFVSFPKIMQKGSKQKMRVYYHGKPIIANNPPWDGGFTWQKDEDGEDWLGVSCEGIGASLWWPNKDHLSDEPDSMRVTCTIPKNLVFVGNGLLEKNTETGDKRLMTWKVSYPINNYNITLNIGNYVNFKDTYTAQDGDKLGLDYWVMPYNLEKAKKQFEQVKPMLACYEKYFGKFPFWKDNYKLVETPYLGMEHQTAIAYGNGYKKGYAGMDYSRIGLDFDYIIIHETGHEYWGNLISTEDMADMWIHESFCTYSEALYVECMFDYNKAQEYVNAKKPHIGNRAPMAGIYGVNVEGDGDMYNKGMLFLNTLRHVVNNDDLWFSLLKEMNEEFAYKTINANDVMFFFNKKTGLDLTPIFMQYLYYADVPKLMYNIDKVKGKNYTLKYKWIANVGDFAMPFEVKIGDNKTRLNGTNQLQQYDFKKKKKDKVKFNQEQFYYKLSEY
ncbi:MAG: M1 family metallopeptidase [Bacteroidetes bacterium]|nr:M1 family metallopeptidase [Bacteroidota bacterium]